MEIILLIAIVIVDQVVKYLVESKLALGFSIPVIKGVFQITNVHNTGAAWGIMSNGRTLFLILTPILCAAIAYILVRYRKSLHIVGRICLTLLLAGAIGNFIDRLFIGYVRDMLDFCLISFPVFNVADSAITIGAILLLYDTVFHKEDSVFAQFDKKRATPAVDPVTSPDAPEAGNATDADNGQDANEENGACGETADSARDGQAPGAGTQEDRE